MKEGWIGQSVIIKHGARSTLAHVNESVSKNEVAPVTVGKRLGDPLSLVSLTKGELSIVKKERMEY